MTKRYITAFFSSPCPIGMFEYLAVYLKKNEESASEIQNWTNTTFGKTVAAVHMLGGPFEAESEETVYHSSLLKCEGKRSFSLNTYYKMCRYNA